MTFQPSAKKLPAAEAASGQRALLAALALATLAACDGRLPWAQPQSEAYVREPQAALSGLVRVPKDLVWRASPSPQPNQAASPDPAGPEWPVENADVFVADAAGTRIPGVPRVQTNADGRYRLAGVPLGYAYVVTAVYRDRSGRMLRLRALAEPSAGDETVDLASATTIAADHALAGARGLIDRYDAPTWTRAVAALDRGLVASGYPDLGDPFLVDEARAKAAAADAALAADLAALRAALAPAGPSPTPTLAPSEQPASPG